MGMDLNKEYLTYLYKMREEGMKRYKVRLFKEAFLVREDTLGAYNTEHLMLEIFSTYRLENMGITRIDMERVEE